MPLTRFQSAVLRRLAAARGPDSYIAGGIALNRNGPRISNADFRFFPAAPDDPFGFVLHPVDLAANKAAAADRRVARDIVDLVTIHETILPLGAVIAAAVGKFPGSSPEDMLSEITRHSRFTAAEFQALATERPLDMQALQKRIRNMLEDAGAFIASLPSDAVGVVFLDGDLAVQPEIGKLAAYRRVSGGRGGIWATSPEIAAAMLETYQQPKK